DVEPGLDDAVIAQGDAAAGVCAQQAALPEADDVFAASGERAHDGGTPAHIRAVADGDTRRDASLHHGMAECAGVEADEDLMHDGGALREVGAETDAVGVTDAYTRGQDVVDHAGEFIHRVHRHRAPAGQPRAGQV